MIVGDIRKCRSEKADADFIGLFFLLLLMGASIVMSMFISSVAFMVVYGLPLELIAQRLAGGSGLLSFIGRCLFLSWRE